MQKLLCVAFFFLVVTIYAPAQDITRESWVEKPVLHKLDSKYADESAVILLDKRRVEYTDLKDEVGVYKTMHRIIHINDDKGIESFNRIYLPVGSSAELLDVRARTILPSGKIIELDKKNIKDLEEDDRVYKIFALEGLEEGCEVEYYYTFRRNTSFFGAEVLQGRIPVVEASFELISPKRLLFETKPYFMNGKPSDSLLSEKRWVKLVERNIPGAEEEKYSAMEANLKRVEYKLAYNTSRSATERVFTWDGLAKNVFANYTTCSDKEMKKVRDLIDDMSVKKLSTEIEKIVAVENYLKKNFAAREDLDGEDAINLEKVIKTKLASHLGIVRLYGAVFRELNIPHEFLLAGSRKEGYIEKNFENWNNCNNAVIHFTSLKKFMSPTQPEYRFPWIDPDWGGTNAFYCKSTTIGNLTTAYGEVRMLPLEDYSKSVINTNADVKLNKSADTLVINISQIYAGYAASVYKSIFTYADDEEKRAVTKEMIKFGTKSENVVSSKIENEGFDNYHENKPFVLSATVKASELIEKAGNKTIVKIGDIIGPQVEMYQEKPRQFPMSIDYPHVLERKINFTIPDGYVIKNPDDLKINHVYDDKGKRTMGFTSSYEIAGNVLKITVMEEYRLTDYPISQFEDFQKIINAAADFNKVVLVMEKK